jgi:hypothetical protein
MMVMLLELSDDFTSIVRGGFKTAWFFCSGGISVVILFYFSCIQWVVICGG